MRRGKAKIPRRTRNIGSTIEKIKQSGRRLRPMMDVKRALEESDGATSRARGRS